MNTDHFADVRNKRMGDLTAEQTDRALEMWLRQNIGPSEMYWYPFLQSLFRIIDRLRAPIDMVLHCPKCGMQHIDKPEPMSSLSPVDRPATGWMNPPRRSHLCHGCGHIWRPADVPTNGVAAVKTRGNNDSPV